MAQHQLIEIILTGDGNEYLVSCGNANAAGYPALLGFYVYDNTDSVQYNIIGTESKKIKFTQGNNFSFNIIARTGGAISNEKIYPMMRIAEDTDDTYVPYAMTNKELTEVASVVSNLDMSKSISSSGAYTDLNNVKTSGIYAVFGSALNKPSDVSTIINGTLIVTHKTSLDDVTQTLINGNEGTIYVRTYATATGWSSWYKFTGTVVS